MNKIFRDDKDRHIINYVCMLHIIHIYFAGINPKHHDDE